MGVPTPMFFPLEFQKIKGAQENNAASCTGFLTPHPQHMACKVSSLNSMGVLTPMMHGMQCFLSAVYIMVCRHPQRKARYSTSVCLRLGKKRAVLSEHVRSCLADNVMKFHEGSKNIAPVTTMHVVYGWSFFFFFNLWHLTTVKTIFLAVLSKFKVTCLFLARLEWERKREGERETYTHTHTLAHTCFLFALLRKRENKWQKIKRKYFTSHHTTLQISYAISSKFIQSHIACNCKCLLVTNRRLKTFDNQALDWI